MLGWEFSPAPQEQISDISHVSPPSAFSHQRGKSVLFPMSTETSVYKAREGDIPLLRSELHVEKRIWVLTLMGQQTPDNRLTHSFIQEGMIPALRDIRAQWNAWVEQDEAEMGAALVTTAELSSKIFSNGLDLFNAIADPHFFNDYLNAMFTELLTFPIPTIAAVTGHAFAGGCTLALAHDYRVMNSKRGYICMNEIEFGAHIPQGMLGAIKSVVKTSQTMRKLVLEGHRFTGEEALKDGLVDATADSAEATLRVAMDMADKLRSRCAKNGWQVNKELIHRESLAMQFEPPRVSAKI